MNEKLTQEEKNILLAVAKEAIIYATRNEKLPEISLEQLSKTLIEHGASFVTLHTKNEGRLRGCIGSLEAYQPLILDVQAHAVAAALEDYRFPPVRSEELHNLHVEISCLTSPKPLEYTDTSELPVLLNPGVDGVILKDGFRRATFLPQVWQQLPDPVMFLDHLCSKMGAHPQLWQMKQLEVFIYQVEEFSE